jgi:glycosyltransferase involved in cell wall biosynthesis
MSKQQSILILEDSSKSSFGGGQAITFELCKLIEKEYRLILFDAQKQTIFKDRIKPFIALKKNLFTTGQIEKKGNVLFSKLLESISFLLFLGYNVFTIYTTIRAEQRNKQKVMLYATTKKTIIYAWIISKICKVNYIYHAHSYIGFKSNSNLFTKQFYKSAKQIIAVSNFVKDDFNLPNIAVVKNFVNLPESPIAKTISHKKKFVVASFSSLIPQKGLEYLMESYQFLPAQLKPNVEIRIYGQGFYEKELLKYVNSNVRLLGFCDNPAKVLENEIDITVVPSIFLESFGIAVIESFAYGVPVIGSNQGGPAEIINNGINGYLVKTANAEAIADKISFLLNNPILYHKMSESALNASMQYNVQIFKEKMIEVLNRTF